MIEISKSIEKEFQSFLERPAKKFNKNMRHMLMEFLLSKGAEADYFDDLLFDLDGLFRLLDVIEDEQGKKQ